MRTEPERARLAPYARSDARGQAARQGLERCPGSPEGPLGARRRDRGELAYRGRVARILIAGATGETGRRLVARLRESDHRLRVLTRSAERARASLGPDLEVHEGDVRQAETLRGAAKDVDVVVSTVGSRTYFGGNGGSRVDALGMRNLSAAAKDGSAQHFVLLSAFGLDRRSIFLSAFSLALNRYFRWKAEAEQAVRDAGVPWTIVRPVELRNRPARGVACLNQSEPLSLLRTVSRDLVAQTLAACVGEPAALHKTFEVYEGQSELPLSVQLAAMLPEGERPMPRRTPLC